MSARCKQAGFACTTPTPSSSTRLQLRSASQTHSQLYPPRTACRRTGRWWYANCAWDAFGVLAALDVDGRIESSCPDCGDPYTADVLGKVVDRRELLFHCLVPAAHWWDDIVFI